MIASCTSASSSSSSAFVSVAALRIPFRDPMPAAACMRTCAELSRSAVRSASTAFGEFSFASAVIAARRTRSSSCFSSSASGPSASSATISPSRSAALRATYQRASPSM